MKEKLEYLPTEMKIILLEGQDVITTSGGGLSNDNEPNYQPDAWT